MRSFIPSNIINNIKFKSDKFLHLNSRNFPSPVGVDKYILMNSFNSLPIDLKNTRGFPTRCRRYANYIVDINKKYIDHTSINFVYSLPIYQLSLKFGSKDWLKNSFLKSYLSIESCNKEITLDVLFQKRLDLRESLCKKFKIDCYTFLQPFPGVTGLHLEELISSEQLNYHLEKYNLLKKAENKVIDLQYVLKNDDKISFIDAVHYSPQTNKKIAKEIKSLIFKNE